MPKAATIKLAEQAKGAMRLLAAAIVEGATAPNTLMPGSAPVGTFAPPAPEKPQ